MLWELTAHIVYISKWEERYPTSIERKEGKEEEKEEDELGDLKSPRDSP
jgi:hypothetical protein